MAAVAADRELLFGLLALQNGLINQAQLLAAFQAWTLERSKSLADHLVALGHLSPARRPVVEAMAALHLEAHGGDVEKSLAAVPASAATRAGLASIKEPQIQATLGHVGRAQAANGQATEADNPDDPERTASYVVGTATSDGQRFRVLRPHSRGGLGAVFVALDSELNREVALKQILDKHADDPVSRQRFLLEAEVTGRLEHPGIVPVYGLGTYANGRPYYAMRFVRGETLKEAINRFHADEGLKKEPGRRSLELRKLLRRFTDVCNAIDYAHSRGVIHRDIKPANIVLGRHGETLVVDWGLAKAMGHAEPGAEERTLVPSSASGSSETLPGSALGTPAYMSPEQARGDLDKLGPRSDVYSLGATLYCLLTGRPPLEGDDVGELLRRVDRGDIAQPRQLDASIDRALEAVCRKAMAVEPRDRYATAHALAEDVERWMADEPVAAWREPVGRRVLRWLTRHRTGVTAAGAALLVALAGTAAVLAVQTSANAELKRANVDLAVANQRVTKSNSDLHAANRREKERFDLAMEAIKLFHGDVSEDLLLKEKQFQGLRSKLLKGAAGFYGKLERLLEGQSDRTARAALGRAYFELASLKNEIDNRTEAVALFRKAVDVRRELAQEPGAGAEAVLDLVRSLQFLMEVLTYNDPAEQRRLFREARGLIEGLVAAGKGGDEARDVLAEFLASGSSVETDPREGLELLRRARTIAQELVDKHPGVLRYLELLGGSQMAIGAHLSERFGREAEAIVAYKDAVPIIQRVAEAQPEKYYFQDLLGRTYSNIAESSWKVGELDEAVASERRAVATWRKAADANPTATVLTGNTTFGLQLLTQMLINSGRPAEALECLAQARSITRMLLEIDPDDRACRSQLANNHLFTGQALTRIRSWGEAEQEFQQAASGRQKLVDEHPANGLQLTRLARAYHLIGHVLRKGRRTADAMNAYERAREIRRRLEAAGPVEADVRDMAATCETTAAAALHSAGRLTEARDCCDRAIAIREELLKLDPGRDSYAQGLAESLLRSGSVSMATGDLRGAAALWRRAAALYVAHTPHNEPAIFHACCHGALAGLAGKADTGLTAEEGPSHADQAMAILQQVNASGYRDPDLLRVEPGLDPLRSRVDFRDMMLDQTFPAEPFATAR